MTDFHDTWIDYALNTRALVINLRHRHGRASWYVKSVCGVLLSRVLLLLLGVSWCELLISPAILLAFGLLLVLVYETIEVTTFLLRTE